MFPKLYSPELKQVKKFFDKKANTVYLERLEKFIERTKKKGIVEKRYEISDKAVQIFADWMDETTDWCDPSNETVLFPTKEIRELLWDMDWIELGEEFFDQVGKVSKLNQFIGKFSHYGFLDGYLCGLYNKGHNLLFQNCNGWMIYVRITHKDNPLTLQIAISYDDEKSTQSNGKSMKSQIDIVAMKPKKIYLPERDDLFI